MSELLYAKRNPMDLDRAGDYYCKHVMAMTAEDLHSKSDIAMELGHRDRVIDVLLNAAKKTLTDNLDLCDGDTCTLYDLKMAVKDVDPDWDLFAEEGV
jgi:hypothetical protein